MGVVVSVAKGSDAAYPFSQMGGDRGMLGAEGYYLAAVERGGEPQGTWIGEGLAELGIHDGQVVDRAQFEALYGRWEDIRDPSGETTLGAKPRKHTEVERAWLAKLAAEPGATSDRRLELWREARSEVKGAGVLFFDSTFSVDKTTSLAHASALAAAMEAKAAGDLVLARQWERRAESIWREILTSVRVYVDHIQSEARQVRVGHHGRRIDGIDTGRHEDSEELPVAIFPQHTSRDGDPQLHVHILWLNKVQSSRDGVWRSIDSRSLYRSKGAGSALAAFAMESGLTQAHDFEWVYRPASKGRVIRGVPEKVITAFSSRRTQIDKVTLGLLDAYEAEHGHPADQRTVWSIRQYVNKDTRSRKSEGALDHTALLRDWEEKSRTEELGTLTQLAHTIWSHSPTQAELTQRVNRAGELTPRQERDAVAMGIALAEESNAAWDRETLTHCIARCLPDEVTASSQARAAAILTGLVDRALDSPDVVRLDAPVYPPVPGSLTRANGESVYRAHGREVYTSRRQLALERQLLCDARQGGAPHISPKLAGLREDQETAARLALSSPRTAEIIIGPAGTGKSYTSVKMAEAWKSAGMGKVIGLATTSAARNVLAEEGIPECYNLAKFLGHDKNHGRGYWGTIDIGDNALIILDEATMTGMADFSDLMKYAARRHAKLVILGDYAQLGAVEAGGGLMMLSRRLGHYQLTDAPRFHSLWEAEASFGIRAGDVTALNAYDDHGRLHGGSYEEMAELATRAFLADHLAGEDAILTAYTHREVQDLSRRAQEYLISWGHVQRGAGIELDGATAYVGDLLNANENDNALVIDGRELNNGDLLRVEAIGDDSFTAVRKTPDGWSAPFTISKSYAAENCDLGYARTWHTVEGRTVDRGHAVASDNRTRNGLYPAMTRGRQENHLYAYPSDPDPVDHDHGGPDAEVDRQHRLEAECEEAVHVYGESADPLAILAPVVRRDDDHLSATERGQRELSGEDHLGHLFGIYSDLARDESSRRFSQAVRDQLPEHADTILAETDDLFRALRAAELAGHDGGQALADALAGGNLDGARSLSGVIASRVRKLAGEPQVRERWARGQSGYLGRVCQTMDERQERIGQHTARTAPLWATQALGPVPEDQEERAAWEESAGKLGAYREMFAWDHPGQAIGPEPGTTNPEQRAEWHTALEAMSRVDGIDVRGLTDDQLLLRRQAYERETEWAPKHVAEEMRVARKAEHLYRVEASRHHQEAEAGRNRGQEDLAGLHSAAADSHETARERCTVAGDKLARAQDTRRQWEVMFEPTKRIGLAADAEARRRGLDMEPLRSAEPAGLVYTGSQAWVQARLDGGEELAEVSVEEREEAALEALGLAIGQEELPKAVDEVAAFNRERQEELDERAAQRIPSEDPDELDLGEAWTVLAQRERDAVVQPPRPPIPPHPEVARLAREREQERDAGR